MLPREYATRPTPTPERSRPSAVALSENRALLFVLSGPEQGTVLSVSNDHGAIIGRDTSADLRLASHEVADREASLGLDGAGWFIESLARASATFVNEVPLERKRRLANGDRLRFGAHTIVKFCLVDELEERALHTLFQLTLLDPLTRLYNRKYIIGRLQGEFSFARRHSEPLAVLFIDIDHFKRVNDTYGHPVGDLVLTRVASAISKTLRPEDALGRYGGEEFVVVVRNTSAQSARVLAERIRGRIEKLSVRVGSAELSVTVSVGVAVAGDGGRPRSAASLLECADEALYSAKRAGRNRVAVATPGHP